VPLGRQSVKLFLLPVKLDYAIQVGGQGFMIFSLQVSALLEFHSCRKWGSRGIGQSKAMAPLPLV
jgi:hypothetical protein